MRPLLHGSPRTRREPRHPSYPLTELYLGIRRQNEERDLVALERLVRPLMVDRDHCCACRRVCPPLRPKSFGRNSRCYHRRPPPSITGSSSPRSTSGTSRCFQAQARLLSGLGLRCVRREVRGRAVRARGRRLLQHVDVTRGTEQVAQAPARRRGRAASRVRCSPYRTARWCRARRHASRSPRTAVSSDAG